MNAEQGIGPIKEYLGEDFSYGEIRAVIADFMRIGRRRADWKVEKGKRLKGKKFCLPFTKTFSLFHF